MTLTAETLIEIAMANPANAEIARRLPSLGLNQCLLTAGCLFQAVWNHQAGLPAAWGIKDYDVFYFDKDVSWEAENEVIIAARKLFHDLDVNIEIKNQARVHLWYGQRFGRAYPKLQSTKDGIDRYLIAGDVYRSGCGDRRGVCALRFERCRRRAFTDQSGESSARSVRS